MRPPAGLLRSSSSRTPLPVLVPLTGFFVAVAVAGVDGVGADVLFVVEPLEDATGVVADVPGSRGGGEEGACEELVPDVEGGGLDCTVVAGASGAVRFPERAAVAVT